MKPQILLVEDDQDLGTALKDKLNLSGFTVQYTRNAKEAFDYLCKNPLFALNFILITDFETPPFNADYLFGLLIEHKTYPLKIILISGSSNLEAKINKFVSVFNSRKVPFIYISKPFKLEQIEMYLISNPEHKNVSKVFSKNPGIALKQARIAKNLSVSEFVQMIKLMGYKMTTDEYEKIETGKLTSDQFSSTLFYDLCTALEVSAESLILRNSPADLSKNTSKSDLCKMIKKILKS